MISPHRASADRGGVAVFVFLALLPVVLFFRYQSDGTAVIEQVKDASIRLSLQATLDRQGTAHSLDLDPNEIESVVEVFADRMHPFPTRELAARVLAAAGPRARQNAQPALISTLGEDGGDNGAIPTKLSLLPQGERSQDSTTSVLCPTTVRNNDSLGTPAAARREFCDSRVIPATFCFMTE